MKLSSIKDPTARARAKKLFIRLRSQRDLSTELDAYHVAREAEERARLEQELATQAETKRLRGLRIEESVSRYEKDLKEVLQLTEDDSVVFKLDTDEVDGYRLGTYEERLNGKK